MTITLTRRATPPQAVAVNDAEAVLRHVDRTLGAVAQLEPDLFHSHTVAGRAVVALADTARAATAALGHDAGTALATGVGVVVVRDLVAAQARLQLAVSRGGAPDPEALPALRRRADLAYGRFLVSAPARA